MVDHPLAIPDASPGQERISNTRSSAHCPRYSCVAGFIRSLCLTGSGYARASISYASPGRDRILSLCAKSYVRGGGCGHFWTRTAVWECGSI